MRRLAADLKSIARDILLWLKANRRLMGRWIPLHLASAIRMTHQIWYRTSPNLRFDMGLAWQVQDKNPSLPRLFSKNGGVGGFTCWVGFMPDLGIGLSILTNASDTANAGFDEFFAAQEPGPRKVTALGIRMIRRLARSSD